MGYLWGPKHNYGMERYATLTNEQRGEYVQKVTKIKGTKMLTSSCIHKNIGDQLPLKNMNLIEQYEKKS